MILHTDEQTIDDLRIFGKRDVAGIYDIYNHTHTRGGEKILEEMFRHPLSDKDQINQRSSIIGHFARLNTPFPFEAPLFDMAEKYLSHGDAHTQHPGAQYVLSEKDISNGVSAVITLLQQTRQLIQGSAITAIAAYAPERAAIELLLAASALEPALNEKQKNKLSYGAITAYDQLFRIRERHKITQLLGYLYYLDVYLSVAKVATDKHLIFPNALDKGPCQLKLEGVYHPALANPVGNNVTMTVSRNVIFLTGANMAGKSTFLRAMSTALYIAHMGFPVAAKAMEFTVLDGIYTTINLPDNLGIGASHFYAEVLRVKKMAAELKSGKSLLVIFDELFRGTNVKDAHEATVAVTAAFARKKNSMFVISSHIVEAGEDLQQEPGIGFLYLPTRMKGHVPEYTYTLEEGITDDRHGMLIIRNEGILDILKNGRKPGNVAEVKNNIAKKQIQQP
ncbi:MutS-related protein [Chitinophaga sp. 22321]|uniref:DNA mismatch repair protein n=1 Tax=Chitinophaga hostae TaxID=2831022 RepID=A0ABS5IXF1_9BACT|nr:DNA mismatch repair protein [Chitinophaga hostae]MBS0027635.1 DNA mismatch repair protein [Chitinophaga hostae]